MIHEKDIVPVGRTRKPYGIRGEIMLLFHKPVYADLDVDFYFLEMDGIPVPFFVEEFTGMTDTTARVKFMDVEDEIKASRLVNKRVWLQREMVKPLLGQEEIGWITSSVSKWRTSTVYCWARSERWTMQPSTCCSWWFLMKTNGLSRPPKILSSLSMKKRVQSR